jgi:hypothetical protein
MTGVRKEAVETTFPPYITATRCATSPPMKLIEITVSKIAPPANSANARRYRDSLWHHTAGGPCRSVRGKTEAEKGQRRFCDNRSRDVDRAGDDHRGLRSTNATLPSGHLTIAVELLDLDSDHKPRWLLGLACCGPCSNRGREGR